MAINKNFVIKNGAEINTKLLVVDADTQRVGVGTTVASYTLHVFGTNEQPGGIGASVVNVTGVTTTVLLNVSAAATFSNGPVFIGVGQSTGTPLQPLQVGSATTTKGIYVSGDVGIGETFPAAKLEVVPESTRTAGLFTGTTSDDMVRITQLGSGNALTIEDSANPDSTPVIVDASGDTGIGTDKARAKLHVLPNVNGIAGLFSGSTSNDMVRITQMGEGNALVVEDVVADGTPFIVKATGDTGIGIGSDPIGAKLHVVPSTPGIGGMFTGATAGDMVRITQTGGGNALVVEDEASPDATSFVISGLGSVGIGTNVPRYLLDVDGTKVAGEGLAIGQTAVYIRGDVKIVGDLSADDITLDQAVFTTINVTGFSTFGGSSATLLNVSGITTVGGGFEANQGINAARLNVTGITTLGFATAAALKVSGISTLGFTTAAALKVSGISTLGDTTAASAVVAGVSTFNGNVDVNAALDVSGNITGSGDFTLTDTDAGSSAGPELKLYRNSASPADADYLGQIKFAGESDTGVERNYAKITGKIDDASNGTEDGILEFAFIKDGSQNINARFKSTELMLLNGTDFSVAGDSTFTGDVNIADKIVHTGDTDTAIRFPAADTFTVETGGSERLRVNSTGDMGLGTDSPTSFGPTFQVAGTDPALLLQDTATAVDYFGVNVTSGKTQLWYDDAAAFTINTATGISGTGLVERVRIDSSGRVGIGTDNPTAPLAVMNSSDPEIRFGYNETQDHKITWDGSKVFLEADPDNANGSSALGFKVDGSEVARFNSSANLGIGTDTPEYKTSIAAASGNAKLNLKRLNDASNGNAFGSLFYTNSAGTDVASVRAHRESAADDAYLGFATKETGESISEKLRITSTGNVSLQNDSGKFTAGAGDDLQIYHNGTVSRIDNNVGVLQIRNLLDDSDISLQTDNGSGGAAEYLLCDGSSGSVLLKHYGTTKLTTVADGVDFDGTGSIKVPVGTTAQRPTGQAGDFRYNSTTGNFEGYTDSWGAIAGSGGGATEVDTSVSTVNPTGVGSFATASFRSASVIAQIDQTGSGFQVGRYLMIHDGTNVTVVEESAVATGDMLGSFDGAIVGSNAEFRVTMASAGIATVTTKIDTVTV